jgi:hypothetical protein
VDAGAGAAVTSGAGLSGAGVSLDGVQAESRNTMSPAVHNVSDFMATSPASIARNVRFERYCLPRS